MRAIAVVIIAIIVWAGLLAPKKDLVVVTKQLSRLDGSEGTSPAYLVYYVWNGKQEEHPWWFIFQAPIENDGFEWAVLEVADVGNVYDVNSLTATMASASKFDKSWFKKEMHRAQRTRFEGFQYIAFGTDNLEKEERAIKQVLKCIESEENKKH